METNKDRISYLRHSLSLLNDEIVDKGLQEEYMQLVEDLAHNRKKIEPISDEMWESMLPKEREVNLLAYYHTKRSELAALRAEGTNARRNKRFTEWLESPWIRHAVTIASIVEVAVKVYEIGHQTGLWFRDEEPLRPGLQ